MWDWGCGTVGDPRVVIWHPSGRRENRIGHYDIKHKLNWICLGVRVESIIRQIALFGEIGPQENTTIRMCGICTDFCFLCVCFLPLR